MKIIYKPEGGSKREWDLDPGNPAWDVTYGTEKATEWPWGEFADKLAKGSSIALQALIWVLRKRDEPRLQLSSVTPTWSEVDLDTADDEQDEADETASTGAHAGDPEQGPGEA